MPPHPHLDLTREHLLEILSAVPETIAVIDENLQVQFVNTPETLGYTAEDVRGTPAVDFVPPDQRDALRERLLRVLETAEDETFELPIFDFENEVRWVEGILRPIEREGKVVAIVSATKDITARRRAEEELEKLQTLVPVCSWCGKIREDEGYWTKVEGYIEEHTGSRVTHGMCPDCEGTVEDSGPDPPAEAGSA